MDKNILKETMLSLKGARLVNRRSPSSDVFACGWPAGGQCIVHRASCTSCRVSEPQQLHSTPEALRDRSFKLSVRSETRLRCVSDRRGRRPE
jgi:hypothetical protein